MIIKTSHIDDSCRRRKTCRRHQSLTGDLLYEKRITAVEEVLHTIVSFYSYFDSRRYVYSLHYL